MGVKRDVCILMPTQWLDMRISPEICILKIQMYFMVFEGGIRGPEGGKEGVKTVGGSWGKPLGRLLIRRSGISGQTGLWEWLLLCSREKVLQIWLCSQLRRDWQKMDPRPFQHQKVRWGRARPGADCTPQILGTASLDPKATGITAQNAAEAVRPSPDNHPQPPPPPGINHKHEDLFTNVWVSVFLYSEMVKVTLKLPFLLFRSFYFPAFHILGLIYLFL